MRAWEIKPLRILVAGRLGYLESKYRDLGNYFIFVVHNIPRDAITVWFEPDVERAVERLYRLKPVILDEQFNEAHTNIQLSELPKRVITMRSHKMRGIHAQIVALLAEQCAALSEQIVLDRRFPQFSMIEDAPPD